MDISIYKLKTKFQNLLMPICEKLVRLKITPNQITLTTVLLNIIFAGVIYKFNNYNFLYLTIPVFLFLRMALNALDGMIANKFNQKTKIGVFYNEAGDVVSDTVFFYIFLRVIGINEIYNLIFIFLSALSEYFFIGNQYFDYILILAIILLIFTIYNRIKSSLKGE